MGKGSRVTIEQKAQYQDILKELADPGVPEPSEDKKYRSNRPVAHADLVSLGDQWLGVAVRQQLIQPIPEVEVHRWWKQARDPARSALTR